MYSIPNITPYENLFECHQTICRIKEYKCNNWAIGQLYPDGGPDWFTYFFSIRGIPIFNYLRGNISMGEFSAYDNNIEELINYILWASIEEIILIDEQLKLIKEYREKNWAIGELFPDGGPDEFVVFFAQRNLGIAPYLRGTVSIGYPTAYDVNIKTLIEYRRVIAWFHKLYFKY